jgi:protein phosphatase
LSGDKLYCINVGDSRLYTVSQESVCQITKDHSYVQYLVDTGAITPEEALTHPRKNIITRAVGTHEDVDPDFFVLEGDQIGTYVLICSDGLTNFVSDEEIQRVLMNTADIEQACNTLVGMANANGGGDNITVVILSTK